MTHRAAAAVLVPIIALTAPACRGGRPRPAAATASFVAVDPNSASATDRAIALAQQHIQANPADDNARLDLARAFLQKAREVADPSLYTKAGALLDDLRNRHPHDAPVLVAAGTLALAQHRFSDARRLGQQAVAAAPGDEGALGVLVDADNELGRSDEALTTTQQMVDAKPNLASLSRASYARELRGDLPGAIEAMTLAVTAGGSAGGENVAYVQVLLGNLLLTSGDQAGAAAAYAAADRAFPGFAAAKAGRARLLVAQGHPADAAALLADLVRVQPLAEYAIAEGDALGAAGDTPGAQRAYDLVGVIGRLYKANGVNVDLELALFAADHGGGKSVVDQARKAERARPSPLGHDVLAWSLFRAGQLDAAARESALALRLGWRDPEVRFHAAAIAFARGDKQAAAEHLGIVLATNPRFSAYYAPMVADLAARLNLPSGQG